MADGLPSGIANAILNSVLNDVAFTAYGPVFIQLHTGAPGAAGTTNIATNSTRQSCGSNPGWSTPSGGAATNANAITWLAVSTTETYTHFTVWSASSSGVFIGSGSVTNGAVVAGNDFTFAIGQLSMSYTVAS